jgi:hypothetical protein
MSSCATKERKEIMPYITVDRREALTHGDALENAGELNYIFTTEILGYIIKHGKSYQTFNDILGALEGAKQEFYRRVVAPYEDEKIKQNGDVY